jgi:spoIIIJ-associated protein
VNEQTTSQQFEKLVAQLLELLNVQATIQVDVQALDDRKYLDVKLNVEDGGAELIGHHGSILESLSTVLSMIMPRGEENFGVVLDVNGYRDARSKYIEDITHKAIEEVISSQLPIVLAPMKPWERRIVHNTVGEKYDVVTESQGEEPERKVVIKPAPTL